MCRRAPNAIFKLLSNWSGKSQLTPQTSPGQAEFTQKLVISLYSDPSFPSQTPISCLRETLVFCSSPHGEGYYSPCPDPPPPRFLQAQLPLWSLLGLARASWAGARKPLQALREAGGGTSLPQGLLFAQASHQLLQVSQRRKLRQGLPTVPSCSWRLGTV